MADTSPTIPPPGAAAPGTRRRAARPSSGVVVLVALLGAMAYAAFAGGAVHVPDETWLQSGIALLALVAAAAWLGPGSLRPRASGPAVAGLLCLAVLAGWTGASLLWSVAPDRTWAEVNRTMAYGVVAALAIAAGSAVPRAIERIAGGFLAIATAVALYALAGRIVPGVVDHATEISRLRAPLEYWNALALLCALAAPIAMRVAAGRDVRTVWRLLALVALFLLICTIGMTYSRGGVVALVVAVVVATAAGGARLTGLAAFALAVAAAAPVLAFAWTDDTLVANAAPLAEQIDAGLRLGTIVALAGALLAAFGCGFVWLEPRVAWSPRRTARVWGLIGAVCIGLMAGGIALLITNDRGFRGTIEHAADSFTEVRRDPLFSPERLLTTGSGNRWAWWRESAGAFSDEPVLGWGAGSFPVSRRLYRVAPSDVLQPHSVPMQWLAELGAVGTVLGVGALALLLAAAVARVSALPAGRERDLAGALLAAAAAWSVHALVDWDWDIPGVTLPVLVFLGVLGARRAAAERPSAAVVLEEPRAVRPLALFATALLACAFLVSAVLPAWSDAKADDALQAVTSGASEARLEAAAADAELAARLDPVAVRPLFAAAAVAERRGRLLEARAHLLDAVERQPYSVGAWRRLTRLALTLADREGAQRAAERMLELDPGDVDTIRFASRAQGILAPPEASPTAVGTPLPAAPGAAATP